MSMNKPSLFRLVNPARLLPSTTGCLTGAWVFWTLLLPCRAQTNSSNHIDDVPKKVWRNSYESQSGYRINGEVIKHQLKVLLKSLSHLSVVDPAMYCLLQGDLHAYIDQLEQEHADYGNPEIYHGVQLRLIRFDNQIKEALVESRRLAHETGLTPDMSQDVPKGVKVAVRPYALLFNKPDYQSTLRHIISPKETVTVLSDRGTYCLVKCAVYTGYLSKGMIVDWRP